MVHPLFTPRTLNQKVIIRMKLPLWSLGNSLTWCFMIFLNYSTLGNAVGEQFLSLSQRKKFMVEHTLTFRKKKDLSWVHFTSTHLLFLTDETADDILLSENKVHSSSLFDMLFKGNMFSSVKWLQYSEKLGWGSGPMTEHPLSSLYNPTKHPDSRWQPPGHWYWFAPQLIHHY